MGTNRRAGHHHVAQLDFWPIHLLPRLRSATAPNSRWPSFGVVLTNVTPMVTQGAPSHGFLCINDAFLQIRVVRLVDVDQHVVTPSCQFGCKHYSQLNHHSDSFAGHVGNDRDAPTFRCLPVCRLDFKAHYHSLHFAITERGVRRHPHCVVVDISLLQFFRTLVVLTGAGHLSNVRICWNAQMLACWDGDFAY